MFAEIFKESDMVHACPAVATLQQMEEWTKQPCVTLVTDTESSNLDNEYNVMP